METEKSKSNITYQLNVIICEIGETSKDKATTIMKSEFSDDNPLIARKKAFDHCERLRDWVLHLDTEGFLELTSPAEATKRGHKNYTSWSYEIYMTDSEDGHIDEDTLVGGTYDEDIENLMIEYSRYKRRGYEIGETMMVKDRYGKRHKILKTDLSMLSLPSQITTTIFIDRIPFAELIYDGSTETVNIHFVSETESIDVNLNGHSYADFIKAHLPIIAIKVGIMNLTNDNCIIRTDFTQIALYSQKQIRKAKLKNLIK